MNLLKHKKLLWLIALWFALMQTMAPFIHGHLEADRSSLVHGLHFHDDAHEHGFAGHQGHVVHDSSHVAHTVVIATGIKKDRDDSWFAGLSLLALMLVLLPRPSGDSKAPLTAEPPSKPLYRRRPSSPRAPPLPIAI